MTAKLDGTNGLLQQYDYQAPTTGFSYTFAAGTTVLILQPAGTLATGTITMPAAPADGMTITVESTQQVTALTMSGNGGTVVGPAIQLIPNQPLSWVYRLTNTSWYPLFGGAGRASALVSGTAVTCAGQTSIDFTGIPSWVKRITVMFAGVSTSGTSVVTMLLGTGSTTYATSGYLGTMFASLGTSSNAVSNFTTAITTSDTSASTWVRHGLYVFTNITGNSWTFTGSLANSDTARTSFTSGSVSLGAALTAVRITTVNGTDTFDTTPSAGTVNILYE